MSKKKKKNVCETLFMISQSQKWRLHFAKKLEPADLCHLILENLCQLCLKRSKHLENSDSLHIYEAISRAVNTASLLLSLQTWSHCHHPTYSVAILHPATSRSLHSIRVGSPFVCGHSGQWKQPLCSEPSHNTQHRLFYLWATSSRGKM